MRPIARSLTFFSVLASLLGLLGIAAPFSSSLGAAELAQQTEVVKLTPSGGDTFQFFGFDVAVEDTTLVVSAINDFGGGVDGGAVYLFERQEGKEPDEWVEVAKIFGSDTAANDDFGASVALDEDTLFVGAVRHVSGGVRSGAVYVFERDAGGPDAWGEVAKLVPSVAGDFDLFGMEVAVDDDVLVVGAIQALDSLGAVYVFERDSSNAPTWEESAILTAPGLGLLTSFGLAVAVDEDRILVGAPGEFIDNDTRGAAYLFEREDHGSDGWALVERFVASDDPALGFFGVSVAIEDDLLVSGAYGANFACPSTFFGFWSEEPKLIPSDNGPGHSFGISLSMEEDRLLVGAMWSNSTCSLGTCRFPGAAYLFERDSFAEGGWNELVKFIPSDAEDGALHGWSTALSGGLAVAGAHFGASTGSRVRRISIRYRPRFQCRSMCYRVARGIRYTSNQKG